MENPPSSAVGALNRGALAYHEGRLDEARDYFAHALLADPEREVSWLWFATVAEDPAEQRYCLNRALAINPESAGLKRLALLPPGQPRIPRDLIELDQPPLPPDLAMSKVSMPLLPRTAVERRHRAQASRPGRSLPDASLPDADAPASAQRHPFRRFWWLALIVAALLIAAVAIFVPLNIVPPVSEFTIAYVGPLSGADAAIGQEQLRAIEMAVNSVNAGGGIDGRRLNLVAYDDANDPAVAAARAEEIVANEAVLLVIGHDRSDVSLAAKPIYEQAGLAAISPSSTADTLTERDDWYFRSIFTNRDQGEFIAAYVQHALNQDRASIVSTAGTYESSLAEAFAGGFSREGTIVARWTIDPANRDASIATIVDRIAAEDDPGILFLALRPAEAHALLLALGRVGIALPLIGGEAVGYQHFANLFDAEPEELEQPGFFTNGLYAASPMIYDSLGGSAIEFLFQFRDAYDTAPEWFGAKAHDAATLAIHAISGMASDEAQLTLDATPRERVRDALAATNSIARAVPGLSGPLYFDAAQSIPQSLSIGQFDLGALVSAPLQYRAVADPDSLDLGRDAGATPGLLFEIDGQRYRQYRVAYVGLDVNEVSGLDPQEQTFNADFFLWFRYSGDDAAEDVFFANAVDPAMTLPEAIDRTEENGKHFAMYRVDATFSEPMNFQDYPWDRHVLTIHFQNLSLSQNDIVYVPDQTILAQSQASRLQSAVDRTKPFNRIPSWIAERVIFAQESATSLSTVPNPRTGAPQDEVVSVFVAELFYARDVRTFLIKNLLPLALLALVTYISLFFSPENAGTRIGFAVTAILTTSVLLQSIAQNLPEIGYTVAIEWGYYVYIALAALLVLLNITIERWYKARRFAAVRQLDLIARIVYPVVLAITIGVYVIRFG